jgi:hypothetical protein
MAVAPALPRLLRLEDFGAVALPVIKGDGVHDDWAGLQALFNNEPFVVENEGILASSGLLRLGVFKISRTLRVHGDFAIHGSKFMASEDFQGDPSYAKAGLSIRGHARLGNMYIKGFPTGIYAEGPTTIRSVYVEARAALAKEAGK